MTPNSRWLVAATLILPVILGGCGAASVTGPVTHASCPMNAHTVAYPYSPNPNRAYGCISDNVGFNQGQDTGFARRNPP
jgi:hypothetical protein